jgi:hypothetical protein
MPELNRELIQAAIAGLEAKRKEQEAQVTETRKQLGVLLEFLQVANGAKPTAPVEAGVPSRKGKMSAAARKSIAMGQKVRWAKSHELKAAEEAAPPAPKKRHLSAAGRKAIVAATKRRWAKQKASS